mgnify:CR=1 FL=1
MLQLAEHEPRHDQGPPQEPRSDHVDEAAVDDRARIEVTHQSLRRLSAEPPPAAVLAEVGRVAGAVRRRFLQHELKSVLVLERTLGGD